MPIVNMGMKMTSGKRSRPMAGLQHLSLVLLLLRFSSAVKAQASLPLSGLTVLHHAIPHIVDC